MLSPKISRKGDHAIVVGGGIAGLLFARVLVGHFERITLIERDRYPTEAAFRAGVPQGRHVHTMLLRGQACLERLFPGLTSTLLAHGAVERDFVNDSIYYYGARCAREPSGLRGYNCSRPFLEHHIHQEVKRYNQISILEAHEVVSLLFDQNAQVVCGVRFHRREPNCELQDLQGDLVIDASGASSRILQWLEELGYEKPDETVMNAYLGYASRIYEAPSDHQPAWKSIAIQATERHRRGGVLLAAEKGRWIVALAGAGKDYPPTDELDYLAFARSLPDQALYDAIQGAKPLSPIYGYRKTENRWRHFERLERQPEGLFVVGDAMCVFNPMYGQGMTVTLFEALAFDACLRSMKGQKGLARLFQRKVARILAFPWQLAASADARLLGEDSRAKGTRRWLRQYLEAVQAAAPYEPQVFRAMLGVTHMVHSPLALFHPQIVVKVVASHQKRGAK
ncbi:FAD-dependent oxidoreductase [Ktedonosporobacter rubrisoli]|uniref:FAD-dependent oxidoreductase n=1 Tax=Ktedonosporobacter rubrisoli TaxID=2509675 RepID=A0A4P6JP86_KTERU|nr:FAD-dependent monooxygenase [Ktedonosporobacter rubrisoli]QBD77177.1 FAD-dependent oxidoreductase [Ktedonosporobacter rubrisoli]